MKRIFILLLVSFFIQNGNAQDTYLNFKNEIEAFKKNDSIVAPPQNAILFVGSSSFNF